MNVLSVLFAKRFGKCYSIHGRSTLACSFMVWEGQKARVTLRSPYENPPSRFYKQVRLQMRKAETG